MSKIMINLIDLCILTVPFLNIYMDYIFYTNSMETIWLENVKFKNP